jgi:hypothetical protein
LQFDVDSTFLTPQAISPRILQHCHGRAHAAFKCYSSAVKKNKAIMAKMKLGIHAEIHEGKAPLCPKEMQKAVRTQ